MEQLNRKIVTAKTVTSFKTLLDKHLIQVWGISENRDQSYRSNARPRMTSAGLPSLVSYLTTVLLF